VTNSEQDWEKFTEGMGKKHGPEVFFQADKTPPYDVTSTGSYALDFATGIGGFPRGYLIEIFSKDSIGKTSLSYYSIAEAQRQGTYCAFINLEGKFNEVWATQLGVDLKRLHVAQPAHGGVAADILYDCVKSGIIKHVVFDSVGAMLGEEEIDGKDRMGGQAKLVTGMVKRVLQHAWPNRCTVIFLNQARADMNSNVPGAVESPGGLGLKHACAIRIQLKRHEGYQGVVDGKKKEIGFRVSATLKKNKAGASPKRVAMWDFFTDAVDGHQIGIDHTEEIMSICANPDINIIERGGAYFSHASFPGGRIKTREATVDFLRANPGAVTAIREDMLAHLRRTWDPPSEEEAA
jgi:recombination protein RecA